MSRPAVVLILALALASGVAAGDAGQPRDPSLMAIELEVERLRADLLRFEKEELGILGSLERLSMERLLLEGELRGIALETRAAETAVARARARAAVLEEQLSAGRRYLRASLRESYKMGRLRQYRVLFEAEDVVQFARAYRYLSDWTRADSARVAGFLADAMELEETHRTLSERLEELARLAEEGQERRFDLERNSLARLEALRQVEQEKAAGEAAVTELEEAASRLELLIASLPGGQPVPVDGRLVDLYRFRGHLPWPVDGPVKVPFGDIRDGRFGTSVPHPGLDIKVLEGTPVRAIFGGWVVFSDWFRGYGNTVMVDHGGGILSVYAHLRALGVRTGEHVDPSTQLGVSGSTGSLGGPVLYLEIREGGKAVDPRRWLAPAPAKP